MGVIAIVPPLLHFSGSTFAMRQRWWQVTFVMLPISVSVAGLYGWLLRFIVLRTKHEVRHAFSHVRRQ